MTIMVLLLPALIVARLIARRAPLDPEQQPRALGWQALAAVCALVFVPATATPFIMAPSYGRGAIALVCLVAAIGVSGFALGRQWGAPRFWAYFAVSLSTLTAFGIGFPVARLLALLIRIRTPHSAYEVPVLIACIVVLPATCWALLRYAGFFQDERARMRHLGGVFG